MKLTIVGAGAMACVFGARLAPVADVTLTDPWREGIQAVSEKGILLEEPARIIATHVAAVPWGAPVEPADLALILVKSWRTPEIAGRLDRLLKPDGAALTLQNGLGNLETLGPRAHLGVTHQGATLLGPGRVREGGTGPTWIAGPAWVVQLFRRAGIAAESAGLEQVDSLLWGKLVVNCGINALSAVLRVCNGELIGRPDALSLLRQAAEECAAVARAKRVTLPFSDAAGKACEVARQTAVNYSSMLQDVLRGAPTEVDAINGEVVRWSERLGVPTPVNQVLLRMVRALTAAPQESPEGKELRQC